MELKKISTGKLEWNSSCAAMAIAYADIVAAFKVFRRHNRGRPYFLAGHSQGSCHLIRLLQDIALQEDSLQDRMLCAYVSGYRLPEELFKDIPAQWLRGRRPPRMGVFHPS